MVQSLKVILWGEEIGAADNILIPIMAKIRFSVL